MAPGSNPVPITIVQTSALAPMTKAEAKRCCDRIRHHLDDARSALLELHDRQGWRVLGYDSWRTCATAEFGNAQSHVYRILTAAKIERQLGEQGIPERVLRPLGQLEGPQERREVWDAAKAESGEPVPPSEVVERLVDAKKQALPLWDKSGDTSYKQPTPNEVQKLITQARQSLPPEALAELVRQEEAQILRTRETIDAADSEESRDALHERLVTRIRQATSASRRLGYATCTKHLEAAMQEVPKHDI